MKSTTMLSGNVSNSQSAIFAFDVSKDSLNVFSKIGEKTIERSFRNRTDIVETQLTAMAQLAKAAGAEKILVVAESTGNFHDILMRAARRVGLETAWGTEILGTVYLSAQIPNSNSGDSIFISLSSFINCPRNSPLSYTK